MRQWKTLGFALVAPVLAGCATGGTLDVPRADDAATRARLREQWAPHFEKEKRTYDIMWKLVFANGPLCPVVEPRLGFNILNEEAYEDDYRNRVWPHPLTGSMKDEVVVQYVPEGSPGWNAGVRPGDRYSEPPAREPLSGVRDIEFEVQRDAAIIPVRMRAQHVCTANVSIARDAGANALTDGKNIGITTGMIDFVANDHELAFVLGHELAHIAMDHIGKRKTNAGWRAALGAIVDIGSAVAGVNTGGAWTSLGARSGAAAFSQDFEREADYLGMYMMARAGFRPDSVASFWARSQGDAPPVWGVTHPVSAERELNIGLVAAEIAAKEAAGESLVPNKGSSQ